MSKGGSAGADLHLALVEGEVSAVALAAKLVAASARFSVTPMPDGVYAFAVRREPAVVALVQRHLAADGSGAQGPAEGGKARKGRWPSACGT